MVNRSLLIVWSAEPIEGLLNAYSHIYQDSPQNAEHVKDEIILAIEEVPDEPRRYPMDRFKINNDGNYRAFEKHGYRIVYKIENERILILRVRHSSREPHDY